MLMEDNEKGMIVSDLVEKQINNIDEVIALMLEGNLRRTMGSTTANQFSSRSHALMQVNNSLVIICNICSLSISYL